MKEKNMAHKQGGCEERHIHTVSDFCNEKVVTGGKYCIRHTCIIQGCKKVVSVSYPLLPGEPRFCSKHYTEKYVSRYGAYYRGTK